MNIVILARALGENHSNERLQEAGIALGHHVSILDVQRFSPLLVDGQLQLLYEGQALPPVDAVIPRIGASITPFSAAVMRHFAQQGVFVLNPVDAILATVDKFRSLQLLCAHGISTPATAFVSGSTALAPTIERLGGAPVVLKLLSGTQGVGVMLADSTSMALPLIETLQSLQQHVLVQKFVAESRGLDVRAFVIGDQVVAAMRRKAQGDEFRSNLHRGGVAEVLDLEPAYASMATKAAAAIGLRVAGVDMLVGHDGPKVIEVNASPGLEGIENTTGLDIASMVLRAVEAMAKKS